MRVEFSKVLLVAVILTYFAGVVIGGYIVFRDPFQLGAYLAYIGAPTGIAIGFYAWKAKAENLVKLGYEPPREEQPMMGGDERWRYGDN